MKIDSMTYQSCTKPRKVSEAGSVAPKDGLVRYEVREGGRDEEDAG